MYVRTYTHRPTDTGREGGRKQKAQRSESGACYCPQTHTLIRRWAGVASDRNLFPASLPGHPPARPPKTDSQICIATLTHPAMYPDVVISCPRGRPPHQLVSSPASAYTPAGGTRPPLPPLSHSFTQ